MDYTEILLYSYILVLLVYFVYIGILLVHKYVSTCIFEWIHVSDTRQSIVKDDYSGTEEYLAGGNSMEHPGRVETVGTETVTLSVPKSRPYKYWEFNIYDNSWRLIHSVPMQKKVIFGDYKYPLPSYGFNALLRTSRHSRNRKKIGGKHIWVKRYRKSIDEEDHIQVYDDTHNHQLLSEACRSIVKDMEANGSILKSTHQSEFSTLKPPSKYIKYEQFSTDLRQGETIICICPKRSVEFYYGTTPCIKPSHVDENFVYFKYTSPDHTPFRLDSYIYGISPDSNYLPFHVQIYHR